MPYQNWTVTHQSGATATIYAADEADATYPAAEPYGHHAITSSRAPSPPISSASDGAPPHTMARTNRATASSFTRPPRSARCRAGWPWSSAS